MDFESSRPIYLGNSLTPEGGLRKPILLALLGAALLAGGLWAASLEPGAARAALGRALVGLEAWRGAHPGWLPLGYFAAYVAVAAASLPVAVWMTLGAGALFGFWGGLVLVSFAAALGATGAFLAARWLARDWVRARFGARLGAIEAGLARDGALYLFSLRLIPVAPFFIVNLLFGLTPMAPARFYWVSQIGMLPATAAYVFAGTRLAEVATPADVLSPGLIGAFVAIGVLPWLARGGLALWRRLARARRWPRPARAERNLVVIGGGAAGLVAAYVAAAARARVTLIAEGPMGGDCLNFGCVPSKALIAAARAADAARGAPALGIEGAAKVHWPTVMAHVRGAIAAIAPNDSEARYRGLGVEVIRGRARLVSPHEVAVETGPEAGRRITTRAVVLATGAAPVVPPIPGVEGVGALTSETLWGWLSSREAPPRRLLILGGGAMGCELAQALARLGAGVVLVEPGRLLAREEEEAAALVAQALAADGVEIIAGRVARFEGREAVLESGARVGFEAVLLATGRRARLTGLGLEALGVPTEKPLETDAWLETLLPGVYAAGDLVGPVQLTNAAGYQGWVAAANALAAPLWRFRASAPMPQAVFTAPEIARIGPTRAELAARGLTPEVTRYPLAELDRAIAEGARAGWVEILTDPRGRILGASVVGARASEILAPIALAMRQGLGLGKLLATPQIYPSWPEAAKNAAGRWRQARVSPRALALAARYFAWRRG